MLTFTTPKHHWNYFMALERDLENLGRYIEFSQSNMGSYSIELTHILLSASSEVDVIMKQICALLDPSQNTNSINDYRGMIQSSFSAIINEEVSIDRFGITFKPWENWNGNQNPDWWKSYNRVKHERNNYFTEANLQNTINAVGGLLLCVTHYYKLAFSSEARHDVDYKETTRQLKPDPTFLRINSDYYYHYLVS